MKYYFYHLLSWPQLLWVAEDFDGKIIGYCLSKLEEESDDKSMQQQPKHGHITSLSVLRTYRKRGIATELMKCSQKEMYNVYDAEYVSLHVRKSNKAAFHLYNVTLQYEIHDIEKGYYADGEDAYDMRCYFKKQEQKEKLEKLLYLQSQSHSQQSQPYSTSNNTISTQQSQEVINNETNNVNESSIENINDNISNLKITA